MTAQAAREIETLLQAVLQGSLNWTDYIQPMPGMAAVEVLRSDRLHPQLSGNKALKLAGWWQQWCGADYRKIITFGGPYSNHLHATAAFAHALGIELICLVRGYAHLPLTATLQDCVNLGASLQFQDRASYAARYQQAYCRKLASEHQALVIPEGGNGVAGERGCAALADFAARYDQLWLAAGSGTTARALARRLQQLQARTQLVVVNVVADQGALAKQDWTQQPKVILLDGALGGFARQTVGLASMMQYYDGQGLPLDPVYTAKLVHALVQYQAQQTLDGQRILLLHSGGLQGRSDRTKFVQSNSD